LQTVCGYRHRNIILARRFFVAQMAITSLTDTLGAANPECGRSWGSIPYQDKVSSMLNTGNSSKIHCTWVY